MTNAIAVRPQGAMRLHGRSLMTFVLTPTTPITDWLTEIDKRRRTSPAFFVGRPIILDLAAVSLNESQIGELIKELDERGIPFAAASTQAGTRDGKRGAGVVFRERRGADTPATGAKLVVDRKPGPLRTIHHFPQR